MFRYNGNDMSDMVAYDMRIWTYLMHRESYPALGHFSFSNFFKLLIAEIKKKN